MWSPRVIKTGNQKLWLWFGVLAGIGLESNYSMAVFGFAVVLGLRLTRERKAFASPRIWAAGAPYAPPRENRPALLCRKPNNPAPLREWWPKVPGTKSIKSFELSPPPR